MLRRFSPYVIPLLLAGCIDDTATGPAAARPAVQYDHVTPPTPPTTIDVNNYDVIFHYNGLETFYRDRMALFTGGLAYGTGPGDVHVVNTSNGHFDVTETGLPVDVSAPGAVATHQSATVMTEALDPAIGPRSPLGIVTVRETFAWGSAPDDDFVIVRYSLTNTTGATITGLRVGYMADPDFDDQATAGSDYGANIAYFDVATQSARIRTTAGTAQHGIIILDRAVGSYAGWTSGAASSTFPYRDPQDASQWWSLLVSPVTTTQFGPMDVRQYLGAAPISLPPGATEVVTFALLAGDDAADLSANIAVARARASQLGASRRGVRAVTSIQPGTVRWTARLAFPSSAEASAFVASQARCGGAPLVAAAVSGANVDVAFEALALDSRIRSGQALHCAGRLANGAYFAGTDYPVFNDGTYEASRLTATSATELHPTYSADGSKLAYAVLGGGIYVRELAAGSVPALVVAAGAQPSWHPSGGRIAYTTNLAGGTIRTVELANAANVALASGTDPRYSPDGARIAFRRGTQLFVMDADGTNQRALTPVAPAGTTYGYPEWSADGSRIYYTFANQFGPNQDALYWLNPDGAGTPTRVTPAEASQFRFGDITADGKTLLFLAGSTLVFQDMQSGLHTVAKLDFVPSPANLPNIEFSPDGAKVLLAGSNGELYEVTLPAPATPAERAAQLTAAVELLITDGLIAAGDGAQLTEKLTQVTQLIGQGNLNAALNHVGAFINKVNALVNSRRLNHITGAQLTSEATQLVIQLEAYGG